ncbi:MAG: ATP synthase F1 subunit delta [Lachnospiraceae bacterium]|nr:ATP synthase F1 subunit delta [Lachnospiraceae bacterium]
MTQIARMYGGSLYELAAEESLTDSIMQQMEEIRQIFRENPDYVRLLAEPSIPKQEREGLIDAALSEGCEQYLVNFLKLLCERNILNEYSGCCDEFIRRYNADHNIAEATVTSAVSLTEDQMSALKSRLEALSGKQVRLLAKVSPGVLGGLRVELEGKALDGTVSGRLSGIQKKLNEIIV